MIGGVRAPNQHDEQSPKIIHLLDPEITFNEDRLEFPKYLSPIVGLSKERINWMKHQGCKFYGRKTKLRWINEFLEGGAVESASSDE